ncbi:MAG: DoxX family membrane protein [Anaerolineaceae bacterium]|nr:DoxX family membrane protein [Anaerolineaceae bacterium]
MLTIGQVIVIWLLAALFIVAGIAHFTFLRHDFAQIVPPLFPHKDDIVLFTGVLEILGGLGLIIPLTSRWAGIALILYLIAVFPANIYGARNHVLVLGRPHPPVWIRLPFQALLIILLWWVTQP